MAGKRRHSALWMSGLLAFRWFLKLSYMCHVYSFSVAQMGVGCCPSSLLSGSHGTFHARSRQGCNVDIRWRGWHSWCYAYVGVRVMLNFFEFAHMQVLKLHSGSRKMLTCWGKTHKMREKDLSLPHGFHFQSLDNNMLWPCAVRSWAMPKRFTITCVATLTRSFANDATCLFIEIWCGVLP